MTVSREPREDLAQVYGGQAGVVDLGGNVLVPGLAKQVREDHRRIENDHSAFAAARRSAIRDSTTPSGSDPP